MTDEEMTGLAINTIRTLLDRCGTAGQVRTSWYTNGAGSADLRDLESRYALRSRGPRGAGVDFRVGAIRGPAGLCCWYENVWGIRTAQRTPEKVWIRAGPSGHGCKGFAR